MEHFGASKTLEALKGHFFWPHMSKHVVKHYENYITCIKAKSRAHPYGLYTLFPIPILPWVDISTDVMLGLPRTKR